MSLQDAQNNRDAQNNTRKDKEKDKETDLERDKETHRERERESERDPGGVFAQRAHSACTARAQRQLLRCLPR